MSTSRRTLLASLLLPVLAFAACGGDDGGNDTADAGDNGAAGTSEEATTTTAAVAGGTGTGTFTIAGTEFTFDAEPCAIGGDDDQPSVEATGKGQADGKPFTVTVKRSPSEDSVIENFQLVFSATEAMVGTNFVGLPDGADNTKIEVEGDTAKGTFPNVLGTGGRPSGEGSFTLTCER
jgi:hypothetical protein